MLYEITSQEVTTKDYLIPRVFTGSSRTEETDLREILDWFFSGVMKQDVFQRPLFYPGLLSSFEVDLSSVKPQSSFIFSFFAALREDKKRVNSF